MIEDIRLDSWFVAFVDSELWWHRPLRRGFRHCFAFTPDRDGTWLLFNPGFDGIVIRAMTCSDAAAIATRVRQGGGTILRARVEAVPVRRPRILGTCVTALAALLAIRCCAVTPYGLYRTLLAHGAEPAFENV